MDLKEIFSLKSLGVLVGVEMVVFGMLGMDLPGLFGHDHSLH